MSYFDLTIENIKKNLEISILNTITQMAKLDENDYKCTASNLSRFMCFILENNLITSDRIKNMAEEVYYSCDNFLDDEYPEYLENWNDSFIKFLEYVATNSVRVLGEL